jgi:hypothetical protein
MEETAALPLSTGIENNNKGSLIKWFLPFLGLVILIEVVIGVKTLLTPIPAVGKIAPLYGAKISLIPSKESFKIGDYVPVAIRVSTGGRATVGTDLVLQYDPKYLEAPAQANFLRGQIYKDYPVISIDNKTGQVRVSGVDSPGESGFSGIGILGEMIFTAKKEGKTTLQIQFKPGGTNLTNVIENTTAKNLLDQVYNLDVNISQNSKASANLNPTCSPRTLQMCVDDQGRSGSQWCTNIQDPLACQIGCFKDKSSGETGCNVVVNNFSALPSQNK